MRVFLSLAITLLLILPASTASADVDIAYEEFTLPNGLRVVVHEDRKAPIIAVSIWYHVGSKDEPKGKTGFAHLFEHLMFNGSENHDAEYFEPLEEVGATSLNGTTWFDRTNYFQNVPTPALELALFLESDRMGHLLGAITQEKLDNQRGVVQNEKRQGDNQPYGLSEYRVLKGLYPEGHPYRWSTIGSMEDLNDASLDDVKDWFKRFYGPNNAVLVLAGDIDAQTARPLVEKYFADIPAGPPLPKLKSWVPELEENVYDTMEDRVPQARIQRIWNLPGRVEETATKMYVAGAILGSGKNSRLYKKLIFDEQVATSVYAGVQPFELTSQFEIQVDIKPGVKPQRVNDLIDEVVEEFLKGGPTKDELSRVKTRIRAAQIRGLERVGGFGGKATTLAQGALYAGDPGFYKTEMQWAEETTPKELKELASDWLEEGYYQLTTLPYDEGKAASEGADRSRLPAVAASPDIDFPDIERATLSNGVEVVFAQRSTVPIIRVALQFDAGYAADSAGKLGLSNITMSMLDEGTGSLDALALGAQLERLGASLSTYASLDTATASMSALKENVKPSLALLRDVVSDPRFAQEDLDRVRRQVLAGIDAELSDPQSIGLRLLPPLLYGEGHPYGVPLSGAGEAAAVQAFTVDDLKAYKDAWLRPDNATIFAVGDTTLADFLPLLEENFGKWKTPKAPLGVKNIGQVALAEKSRVIIVDRPGSPQSLILGGVLAPPTSAQNNIAINAMNNVIGGQFTARVNMNLREDKGWAYGARTFLRDAKGQRPFIVYAPVQADRTADSVAELLKELNEYISTRPVTDAEMERVVKNSVRKLPGQFETASAVLGSMLRNKTFARPDSYVESLPEKFRSLDLEQLMAAAEDVIRPDRITWLIMGDAAQIRESIEALDIGSVTVQAATPTSGAR
ncbi:MAG: pitrilysin family protein [Pseudomonadota bacterium]